MTSRTWILIIARAAAVVAVPPCSGWSQNQYCAFDVIVNSPSGKSVAGADVLEEQNGKVFAKASTDQHGVARICDSPAGLVEIHVGGNLCGAVVVKYLQRYWLKTRRVAVTYENCSGEEWATAGGCQLTIRVRDEGGRPVSGARFGTGSSSGPGPGWSSVSDMFGRIFRFLAYGTVLTGQVTKPGYTPATFTEQCKPGGAQDRERVLVLQKE